MGSLAKEFENNKDIVFLFISDEDPNYLKDFLKDNKFLDFPIYMPKSKIELPIKIKYVPTTIIVPKDSQAKIIYSYVGAVDWHTTEIINWLRSLLK